MIFDPQIFDSNIFDTGITAVIDSTLPVFESAIVCRIDRAAIITDAKPGGLYHREKFVAPHRYTKELDRMLRQDDELMEMVAQMFMEINA